MENGKVIEGFPNYKIFMNGTVLNIVRNKFLNPSLNSDTYLVVCL